MLWVTIRIEEIGIRPSAHRSSRSVRSVSAVSTSRDENGSSMSSTFGCTTRARARPDALAHAAGEFLGIGTFKAIETDEVDGRQRALLALVGSDALGFEPDLDVLQDGEPREQGKALEHHRDLAGRSDHLIAGYDDGARCRRQQARNDT